MTKAERNAIKAAAKDLMSEGVGKELAEIRAVEMMAEKKELINEGIHEELAEIMARAFIDCKLIVQ